MNQVEHNYATSTKPNYPHTEFTCLKCYTTWFVPKYLSQDNTWKILPHRCEKCNSGKDLIYLQETLPF